MIIPLRSGNTSETSPQPFTILAGDVGATKTSLALFQFIGTGFRPERE